ncbi:aquaporin-like protein [Lactarius indigo]|nr:aquaporin-like protein [Lactarius indigo]
MPYSVAYSGPGKGLYLWRKPVNKPFPTGQSTGNGRTSFSNLRKLHLTGGRYKNVRITSNMDHRRQDVNRWCLGYHGVTAFTWHRVVHLADVEPRPAIFRSWERTRHRRAQWLVECVAEMLGVFCYCYAGVGATAAFVVGNILGLDGAGSLLTVGFAYALGIVVALVVFSATSGGHFSPAVTLPKEQGYIVAQIFGGFAANLFVYWQWRTLIQEAEAALIAAGKYQAVNFSSQGPAGIFALYSNPADPVGLVFLNELVSDFFIGVVISACLDPTNFFAPPGAVPWIIGPDIMADISNTVAANTARDVGGRLAAIAIWGTKANGGSYAAIAALTNILATFLAYSLYEFVLKDSSRGTSCTLILQFSRAENRVVVLTVIGKEHLDGQTAQAKHREYHLGNVATPGGSAPSSDSEKGAERLEKETQ